VSKGAGPALRSADPCITSAGLFDRSAAAVATAQVDPPGTGTTPAASSPRSSEIL